VMGELAEAADAGEGGVPALGLISNEL
jgi:hypothetical protein